MARKPRVYEQGIGTFVIGTADVDEALACVGISDETHCWAGTGIGLFARRQGLWRSASFSHPPKDAKPGVCFYGSIRPKED